MNSMQGRETYAYDFVQKKKKSFNVGLHSNIYKPISFKHRTMIETTKLYILTLVYMTLTFIQGHSCLSVALLRESISFIGKIHFCSPPPPPPPPPPHSLCTILFHRFRIPSTS